jgi:hypothetical protein
VDCVGQLVRERDSLINGWTERKDDAKWAEKRGRVRIIYDHGSGFVSFRDEWSVKVAVSSLM